MIKSSVGQRLDALLKRLLPFLFSRPINPDLLSVLGAVVSAGAALAFARGSLFAGSVIMLAGGVFDLIDGVVARHHGISTRFGAFLDSTLDRLVDMMLLLGLAYYFAFGDDFAGFCLAAAALVGSVLVSYAKARAELVIPDFKGGLLERAERIVILAVGGLTGMIKPALFLIALGSWFTATQRCVLAYRGMRELDRVHEGEGGI